ncbi:MAG: redoxin domain-containing protein [Prevotella sp.]|nr:redoxin domain-containing protein [Prevotella sp.]
MNRKFIFTMLLAMLLAPLGMEAKKVKKEQEVPQLLNYPSAEVSEYRLHGGNVVFKGRIAGVPGGEAIPKEFLEKMNGAVRVIMRDYIVNKEKTSVIEFKPDGTFSMNVYVPYPMFVLVHPLSTMYACPGDTLEMTIDPTKPSREEAITWDGTGLSGEVTKLHEKIRKAYCDFPARDNIHEKGPDSLMAWRDVQVACLDDVVQKINTGLPELEGFSPLASDILRTYIVSQHLEHICRYYMLTDMDNIDRAAYWQQFFSFVAPREKYLLDNPLLMITGNDFFFNYVEYTVMRPMYASGVMDYIPFEYDPQIAEAISKEKHIYRREFRRNVMNELHDKLNLSTTDFSAQVCQLRYFFNTLEWHKDQYDTAADDFAATMVVITHPDLIGQGILTYRDYVKEKEIKVVEQKPMTKGDSIFQRIIEPYKGSVLYIDFWEMSCGPCRATMLQMRDEVEANKDKPVKYLYITDDTPEKCKSFLKPNNIKGEHIHITRAEWGYLQEKFNFSGIPFVMLFDKQGKRRDDATIEQLLNE